MSIPALATDIDSGILEHEGANTVSKISAAVARVAGIRVAGTVGDFGATQPDKYRSCQPLPFRQWWKGPDQMPLEGAVAYIGVADAGLVFYVCLNDSDVFSQATADNQRLWKLGDVVEFFVKPGTDRDDYWEIHVAPTDHIMALHIPNRETFGGGSVAVEDVLVDDSGITKRVGVFREEKKWAVEIVIPWQAFSVPGIPNPGTVWQFAVCRYNYSGGLDAAEHSSIAPLTALGFHRHEEYCELVF